MSVVIWHNPRCSKSRATLKLLEEKGIVPEVRLYLQDPPTADEIRAAIEALGIPAIGLVRTGEAAFKESELTKDSTSESLLAAMVEHPILIERPVVFAGAKARIGRPPESVLEII